MSSTYNKVASLEVRNILWKELQDANLLDIQDYYADGFSQPLIPIIPSQQVPEFNNLLPQKTYIIYDVQIKNMGVQWWMNLETMTFQVTSTDHLEVHAIINFINDVFRRYDQSASEANMRITTSGPFIFHYFKVVSADPVQEFTNEGGFMTGLITIEYSYSRELDSITGRYAPLNPEEAAPEIVIEGELYRIIDGGDASND